jgi:hypothetical protein
MHGVCVCVCAYDVIVYIYGLFHRISGSIRVQRLVLITIADVSRDPLSIVMHCIRR